MPNWELWEFELRVAASSKQQLPSFEHVPFEAAAVDFPLPDGPSIDAADHSLANTGPMDLEPLLLRVFVSDVSILFECLKQGMPNRG